MDISQNDLYKSVDIMVIKEKIKKITINAIDLKAGQVDSVSSVDTQELDEDVKRCFGKQFYDKLKFSYNIDPGSTYNEQQAQIAIAHCNIIDKALNESNYKVILADIYLDIREIIDGILESLFVHDDDSDILPIEMNTVYKKLFYYVSIKQIHQVEDEIARDVNLKMDYSKQIVINSNDEKIALSFEKKAQYTITFLTQWLIHLSRLNFTKGANIDKAIDDKLNPFD